MYYVDNKGYILVRDDGAHLRHGEVRVSKHAAKMALSNYMKKNDANLLHFAGCSDEAVDAIDWVYTWVRHDGWSLASANTQFQKYHSGITSVHTVTDSDLKLVDELREKEHKRWSIVEVPVVKVM